MTRSSLLAVLVCSLVASSLLACSTADAPADGPGAAAAGVTAFVGVNVVPLDSDRVLADRTVLVRGGAIEAVGPADSIEVPADARVVDGRGAYLAPGLTDAHAHLEFDPSDWFALFLASGVTTVFDLRGSPAKVALSDSVRAGEVAGPNIYVAGPFVNLPQVQTPEDAVAVVEDHARHGYDFIKVHGPLTRPTYDQLITSARERGIAVIGHAPRNLPFDVVIENRQSMIAHAEELVYTRFQELDTADVPELAARMAEAGVWLTPTLAMFEKIAQQWGRPAVTEEFIEGEAGAYLTPGMLEFWREGNPYTGRDTATAERTWRMYRFQLDMVRLLDDAGVRMLAGTDAPLPAIVPGASLHAELETLALAGLDTVSVLAAATRNAGDFIAEETTRGDRFGRVEPGYRADLVLLRQNPLHDLTAYREPLGVMANGRWFPRAELDRLLEQARTRIAESHATTPPVAAVELPPAELERFAGRFLSEKPDVAIVTEVRDGVLWIVIPDFPQFPLQAIGPRTFRGAGAPAGVVFDEARDSITVHLFGDPDPLFRARREGAE